MRAALLAGVLFFAGSSWAEDDVLSSRANTPGAGLMPAVLPAGALAFHAEGGIPEVSAGLRQGFGGFELEGRARLDYLQVAFALEGLAKLSVYRGERFDVAPYVGAGFAWDTGATYSDPNNFTYVSLRLLGGAMVTYAVARTFRLAGQLEVPVDAISSPNGAVRVRPVVGGGFEWAMGDAWSVFFLAQAGLDIRQQPSSSAFTGFAYGLKLGLGYRLF